MEVNARRDGPHSMAGEKSTRRLNSFSRDAHRLPNVERCVGNPSEIIVAGRQLGLPRTQLGSKFE
jgi:hypothetical protein